MDFDPLTLLLGGCLMLILAGMGIIVVAVFRDATTNVVIGSSMVAIGGALLSLVLRRHR